MTLDDAVANNGIDIANLFASHFKSVYCTPDLADSLDQQNTKIHLNYGTYSNCCSSNDFS